MGLERERRRWRVRLSNSEGISGAGTMLDEQHVLTCAHVVESSGGQSAELTVDFVGLPRAQSAHAKVVEGCWVPPTDEERGDIALLRLDRQEPGVFPAPLRRMPLSDHQLVRAYGFPEGADSGIWTLARLVGEGGPGCEWIQLHRSPGAEPVSHGFSGTAVIDEATGYVIGMVVSKYAGERVAWMIPVETMLAYLPLLREWTTGTPAVEESFVRSVGANALDVPFTRELTDWLAHAESGSVWVVVTGDADSAKAKALLRVVVLADRERSRSVPGLPAGVGDAPPAGSVDLAVNAAGRTADDVRGRIDDRLDLGTVRSAPGRTLVVDGIDDAAEPDRLVTEVLKPLADRAGQLGIRLMLAFRREPSGDVTSPSGSRPAPQDIGGRLDALTASIVELAAIEEHQRTMVPRFAGVTMHPPQTKPLRGALSLLRDAEAKGDIAWVKRHLDDRERSVAHALEEGRKLRAELDRLHARRAELRARLDGYAEMARKHGLVEDPELDEAYGLASRRLYKGPCELSAAAAAVDNYIGLVHARVEAQT